MVKLKRWDVEDPQFWNGTGKKVAYRNLVISIPNLLCGFSVWLYWGMIAKIIQRVHFANPELFNFTWGNDGLPYDESGYRALMFTLPAVAGLVGATLRIPNSFMIAICGGRNVKFMTTIMLLLPAIGAGYYLQDPNVSFPMLIFFAGLSGVGGGAFASSMSNISFFFPKKMQGLSLGLNAGIGNFGVSIMQFLVPFAVTFGMFGGIGGDPHSYVQGGETVNVWIQNATLVWVPVMVLLVVLAFFLMNNLPQHDCGPTPVAVGKYLWLEILGFFGAIVAVLLLLLPQMVSNFPVNELLWTFIVLIVAVLVTLGAMKLLTPRTIKKPLDNQFAIFKSKHSWVMTWLYTMTFGSFIGYANAFPKLIDDIFNQDNSIATSKYIWIGAGVGALIRPVGGWLSDKLGGARVTQWDTWIMVTATILAGYIVYRARISDDPKTLFIPFLITFIVLFAATGIGNGSTFRMIPIIFSKEQAGPVLGWTSAIAAYGAYLIPKIFATQIKASTPEYALYGFAAYYVSCLAVNWWFYARKNAELPC